MSIHSKNEAVILEFGLKKPAFRIVVNTPTTHGSIGLTTGLDPAMTLGCGGYGGNITSDNISPRHLLNIKRLAYELRPATATAAEAPAKSAEPAAPALPKRATEPPSREVGAADVQRQFASVLGGAPAPAPVAAPQTQAPAGQPVAFVCEDDVRQAIKERRQILVGERTIITPSARDLAAAHRVFVDAAWPQR
jgi:acetaldehyde dehydrogenase (acetylating)